ncbi:MAG: AmmeMemoRadiSam system protein A [Catenisphaera adipataccumulans]|uniref:AmmeMemoRadiSam system protein A n=1 Tax=Catenisphaera adipataccumulans TaxID=700500 RepID=UPI003D89C3F1
MIKGAIMVPHPPVIVSEVGRGEEKQVQATIDAYHQAARALASWQPDTIICISPHAEMYRDYFQISPGKEARGDFARFGAKSVSFHVEYDEELVDAICQMCAERKFPAGKEYPQDDRLDHGTMVPLYFINQYWTHYKLVRLGLSGLPLEKNLELGQIIQACADRLDRRTAVIASGDLSHHVNANSPYGPTKEGPEYEREIMDVMGKGEFSRLLDFSNSFRRRAGECGHGSFTIMSGILDGYPYDVQCLSHEDIFGIGYGVCIYPCRDPYVDLAVRAVHAYVTERKTIDPQGPYEMMQEQAGTFVSIHEHGRLRGCIGTFMPTKSNIASEIISNAAHAATRDPRFFPIEPKELDDLEISVDVLGHLEPVDSLDQLDVKRYGILVSDPYGRRGLLLPDLDGVTSVRQQIAIAMQKAGIEDEEGLNIQRFEVVRHEM